MSKSLNVNVVVLNAPKKINEGKNTAYFIRKFVSRVQNNRTTQVVINASHLEEISNFAVKTLFAALVKKNVQEVFLLNASDGVKAQVEDIHKNFRNPMGGGVFLLKFKHVPEEVTWGSVA